MKTLTSEKLTIVGAAGMIGSNMAQSAILMGLSSNICLYDPYSKGLEGVAEELLQCGFKGVNITYTSNIKEALANSKYIITSGGAARKEGMTREDLLKGNAEIAIQFGKDIKQYCPDVKHVVVIFNPADITGLLVLLYSGLNPSQVSTLAALDSTRLRNELAKHFNIHPDKIVNCRTYGGHGEQMAVFSSTASVDGKPLNSLIGTSALTHKEWEGIKERVIQGGKRIIELRGRSSFQSPAYLSLEMIQAVMGGQAFDWPVGVYVSNGEYSNIMMAMETRLDKNGVFYQAVKGLPEEVQELQQSYIHLCDLRDELIKSGVIPPTKEWKSINPNL
ncbi:malate dehydrogenase [Parabacteroides sp. PF5-5]|uniref:malate dehydrogenase n=1 Tax=unclassified Parabacteroides TaxID=2649774 RepID=UPI002476AC48|nr:MULTISPECIES: malate dehydrogenase [unclassified Parabacteroides]MDH6306656.1 malate dehydrogenase [Parabacteroides sp. PH5-39]MDH6317623.1 malate dehydrogenase [Parabacteroides sp. PF5-13]MDH6321367.1 malate dehydrogenase [Parabacteroides sp. PH5-13]MDH6325068.1 malate dehydrogenase [Parabacteroides sp. PH5-8]MDH6328777.1 malate dehydrogenase [Parabacteroides sp. PH5-41]